MGETLCEVKGMAKGWLCSCFLFASWRRVGNCNL
jgi:hypothetical protein